MRKKRRYDQAVGGRRKAHSAALGHGPVRHPPPRYAWTHSAAQKQQESVETKILEHKSRRKGVRVDLGTPLFRNTIDINKRTPSQVVLHRLE